jgi:hypothetical protein
MECLSQWSSKRQSDCEHAKWTGVANVRSSSGFLWSYHKTSYCKMQRILLMAVSNHYTSHETFDDLTVFFLRIQVFWDMKRCCWMLRSFLRNVTKHSSSYMASHPRRHESSVVSKCIRTQTPLCHCLRLISESYVALTSRNVLQYIPLAPSTYAVASNTPCIISM